MAPFICCGFKRDSSPDPGPIHLVDNSQTRGRFPVSTTESSDSSADAATSVQKIFEAAVSDEAQGGSFQANDSAKHQTKPSLLRKESMRKIHCVANRIKRTVSRDSGISKDGFKRNLRSSMSHVDIQGPRKLESALHRRIASGLQDNKFDSEGEFDEDAMPMMTPRSTWGREQGATVEGISRRLSRTLERSLSLPPASHSERSQRDVSSQTFAPRSATGTLSRMLTVRGIQMDGDSNSDKERIKTNAEAEASEARRSRITQKYIFRDDSKSPRKSPTRIPTPLGRSDTVIRIPSSSAVVELGRPTFLDTLGTQSTPDSPSIEPQRMASISNSIAGREWRLSYAPSYNQLHHLQFPETIANEDIRDAAEYIPGPIRATPEAWTRGASGLFQEPNYPRKAQGDTNYFVDSTSQEGGQCKPTNEEAEIGRVGDDDEGVLTGEFLNMPDACGRKESSGSGSVHLYNMRISQRLASQGLLQSMSQPCLQEFATLEDHIITDESNFADGNPRRRVSSSGLYSGKVPVAWSLPKKYAASSVYSHNSPYITPAESHQSSLMFLNKIADRMNHFGPDAPAQDIISVPVANNKHVNLNQLERRTRETSFHSSNESLYNRELAAAETRFLPRAKTVNQPKSSWFKEDFDDVAAAIADTNPRRRTASEKMNRKPSVSSYDGSKERHLSIRPGGDRFNFVTGGNEGPGASVWEKALREHEQEDAAISRTWLGSDPMLSDHNGFRFKHRHRMGPNRPLHHRHIIDRFSPEHKQGQILQAKLGAYQLPSTPRKRTPTDELKPISTPSSHSSWTRYSSHDREQRSSASAGEVDNVFARDFAEEAVSAARLVNQAADDVDPTAILPAARLFPREEDAKGKRKSKSMTFGRGALAKLRKIYRVGSLEFASRTAFGSRGHRSSISEGRSVEYPELEVLPPHSLVEYPEPGVLTPLNPSLPVFDKKKPQSEKTAPKPLLEPITKPKNAELADLVEFGTAKAAEKVGDPPGAKKWSRMYIKDCVNYPTNSPPQTSVLDDVVAEEVHDSAVADPRLDEAGLIDEKEGEGKSEHKELQHYGLSESENASSSDEVRKSTLDFKKSLESDERRARERVLGLAVGHRTADTPKVS